MQISNFYLPALLCISLFAPAAMAEGIAVPDHEHRQGMSYEEYAKYRETMRLQMEQVKPEKRGPKADSSATPAVQTQKSPRDSAYGQGYQTRTQPEDRPDTGGSRADRPRPERFNRGDMGRR